MFGFDSKFLGWVLHQFTLKARKDEELDPRPKHTHTRTHTHAHTHTHTRLHETQFTGVRRSEGTLKLAIELQRRTLGSVQKAYSFCGSAPTSCRTPGFAGFSSVDFAPEILRGYQGLRLPSWSGSGSAADLIDLQSRARALAGRTGDCLGGTGQGSTRKAVPVPELMNEHTHHREVSCSD